MDSHSCVWNACLDKCAGFLHFKQYSYTFYLYSFLNMTKSSASDLALKALLISHGIYFFQFNEKLSGYILLLTILIFAFSGVSSRFNSIIEKLVKLIGVQILKLVLCSFYFFVIFPLSLFNKKVKYNSTTLIELNRSKINFERPW